MDVGRASAACSAQSAKKKEKEKEKENAVNGASGTGAGSSVGSVGSLDSVGSGAGGDSTSSTAPVTGTGTDGAQYALRAWRKSSFRTEDILLVHAACEMEGLRLSHLSLLASDRQQTVPLPSLRLWPSKLRLMLEQHSHTLFALALLVVICGARIRRGMRERAAAVKVQADVLGPNTKTSSSSRATPSSGASSRAESMPVDSRAPSGGVSAGAKAGGNKRQSAGAQAEGGKETIGPGPGSGTTRTSKDSAHGKVKAKGTAAAVAPASASPAFAPAASAVSSAPATAESSEWAESKGRRKERPPKKHEGTSMTSAVPEHAMAAEGATEGQEEVLKSQENEKAVDKTAGVDLRTEPPEEKMAAVDSVAGAAVDKTISQTDELLEAKQAMGGDELGRRG